MLRRSTPELHLKRHSGEALGGNKEREDRAVGIDLEDPESRPIRSDGARERESDPEIDPPPTTFKNKMGS